MVIIKRIINRIHLVAFLLLPQILLANQWMIASYKNDLATVSEPEKGIWDQIPAIV
jgi:hypothetical protein